jgi:hypothetical protein
METARRWWSRVVWVGIAANLLLALPTLAAPARVIQSAGLPIASPLLWPRFSALLLILLSAFYVPAALDPDRYRVVAWLAVASRLVGAVFFIGFQPADYRMLGYFDFAFFVPELILLLRLAPAAAGTAAPRLGVVP